MRHEGNIADKRTPKTILYIHMGQTKSKGPNYQIKEH